MHYEAVRFIGIISAFGFLCVCLCVCAYGFCVCALQDCLRSLSGNLNVAVATTTKVMMMMEIMMDNGDAAVKCL